MNPTPKTIQIFLPGGDPRGIRVAEITTRIVQVIEVPRSLITDFLKMDESQQVAVYFLVGGSNDESDQPQVYIGQTGDLRSRITLHNKQKDFWERALMVISRTHSLTQTHTLLLEWNCIQAIRDAGRYRDQNGNSGNRPHAPPPLIADCDELFETASTLLATLGHPLFTPLNPVTTNNTKLDETYYCTGSTANGRGHFTSEGMVVLKGSSGRSTVVDSIAGTRDERRREELIENGVCAIQDNRFVFQKDHLFGSPSVAAGTLMGRTANGWLEWKNQAGQTLNELLRQTVDGE